MSKFQPHQIDPDADRRTTSADVAFSLLSSRRRRYILYYLTRCTATVELRELATRIVAWDEMATEDHERIIASLYHVHLPKFEENGILTFDSSQGLIKLEETANDLIPYLELAAEDDFQTNAFEAGPNRDIE